MYPNHTYCIFLIYLRQRQQIIDVSAQTYIKNHKYYLEITLTCLASSDIHIRDEAFALKIKITWSSASLFSTAVQNIEASNNKKSGTVEYKYMKQKLI
jgi:hypothetical protein